MLPVAPLMIEHRLIERMIKLMDGEAGRIRQSGLPNTDFIDVAVDFIRSSWKLDKPLFYGILIQR